MESKPRILNIHKRGRDGYSLSLTLTKELKAIGCQSNDQVIVTIEDQKIVIKKRGYVRV